MRAAIDSHGFFMNVPATLSRLLLVTALGLGGLLTACEDDSTAGTGGMGGAGGAPVTASESSSESSSGSGPLGPELKVIAPFNGMNNELPEGLAISPDGKTAYVGYASTARIVKVSLPGGQVTDFGGLSQPPLNGGQMLGLILDTRGDLFAAVTGIAKAGAGVYKIDKDTGTATLFVDDPVMAHPNGFGFLSDGSLLVTDSLTGVIFRIDLKIQQVTPWVVDPLLIGDASPITNKCAEGLPPFPVGANGITSVGNKVYVVNTDNARLIQIPVNLDGTAGKPVEFIASDAMTCAPLKGADGMTADAEGNLYIAASSANRLIRIDKDSTTASPLVENDGQLDFPATIALSKLDGKRYAYITNLAINSKAKPGLLSYGPLP
jgi:sugar lactone lactonase YvrE